MSESTQPPPSAPVALALYASLCAFILTLATTLASTLSNAMSQHQGATELIVAQLVAGGLNLMTQAWVNFVVIAQLGRHLQRNAAARPWLLIAAFGVLYTLFRFCTSLLLTAVLTRGQVLWPAFFDASWAYLALNTFFQFWDLAGTLLCAWGAWQAAGHRAAAQAGAATQTAGVWVMQALTLGSGILLTALLFTLQLYLRTDFGMRDFPTGLRIFLTGSIPLAMGLLFGPLILAYWPQRLQQAPGWALFLAGWAGSLLSALTALILMFFLARLGLSGETLSWVLSFVVYVFALVTIATITGLTWRDRAPAAA